MTRKGSFSAGYLRLEPTAVLIHCSLSAIICIILVFPVPQPPWMAMVMGVLQLQINLLLNLELTLYSRLVCPSAAPRPCPVPQSPLG